MARAYSEKYDSHTPQYIEVDHYDGDIVVIHLYDYIYYPGEGGHTATSDWYNIDRYTATGTNFSGDYIDLKEFDEISDGEALKHFGMI